MYQPTDLKKGVVCQIDGKPYRVTEYSQKVMGRGGSIVNVKLKNLITGTIRTPEDLLPLDASRLERSAL